MKRSYQLILVTLGAALLTPVALAQQAGTQSGTTSTQSSTSTTTATQDETDSAWGEADTSKGDMRSESDMSGLGMDTQDQVDDTTRPTESSSMSAMDRAAGHAPPTQRAGDEHALWGRLDSNHDGRISMAEGRGDAAFKAGFGTMDANRDGFISDTEYRSYQDTHAGVGMDTTDKAATGTKDKTKSKDSHRGSHDKGAMDETRGTSGADDMDGTEDDGGR